MQTLFRIINLILGPIVTNWLVPRLAGLVVAGRSVGQPVSGVIGSLLMLAVELGLTQGPKRSTWVRRWLDPRAAFEGVWLQDILDFTDDNRVGVFTLDYQRESDSFSVRGNAYAVNAAWSAEWSSTHMFIDVQRLQATYPWTGGLLRGVPEAQSGKSGLTELNLRRPPALALPMTGSGGIFHVGEQNHRRFHLLRITNANLAELGLPFSVRELRLDAKSEESQLVVAFLRPRPAPAAMAAQLPLRS